MLFGNLNHEAIPALPLGPISAVTAGVTPEETDTHSKIVTPAGRAVEAGTLIARVEAHLPPRARCTRRSPAA